MKRKFKLFATVASLCLCLALMAFGVYAASSVSYTMKGSVTFSIADVFVDIDYTYNTKIGGYESKGAKTTVKSYTDMNTPIANGGKLLDSKSQELESSEITLGNDTFTQVGDYVEYIINITNKGENTIGASIILTGVEDSYDGVIVTKTATSATSDSLSQYGVVTYTLKIELLKLTYDVSIPSIQFVASASKA